MTTRDCGAATGGARRRLLHVFPTFAVGGSQRRFGQIVAAAPPWHQHTVLSLDGVCEMGRNLPQKVKIVRSEIEKRSGPGNWLACRRFIASFEPDVLVTYNWGAMDWCIANLVPPSRRHIHVEDGFGPEEQSRQLRRRVWTRRFVLSRRASRLVVPSLSLEKLARQQWRIPPANLEYIPNGVDCARFVPRTDRAGPSFVIGTVASLRREKNLERLIGLFCSLVDSKGIDAELVIVGDGPERAKLEQAARAGTQGRRIRFTGPTAAPEKELARFDAFALSSSTEQMPLSILEAMASGLPIVSLAVGDVPQMVSPANRRLASFDGDAGFVEGLGALAASRQLRDELGRANRDWVVAHYNQEKMLARYAALFA